MIRQYLLVVVVVLGACGKSKTESVAEAKTSESVQKTAAPAVAPVKAPARGPEHPVFSLVDSRLTAHLARGRGSRLNGRDRRHPVDDCAP